MQFHLYVFIIYVTYLLPLGCKFLEILDSVWFIAALACIKALIMGNALIMDMGRLIYSNNSIIRLPIKLKGLLIRIKALLGQGSLSLLCTVVSLVPRTVLGAY